MVRYGDSGLEIREMEIVGERYRDSVVEIRDIDRMG